MLYTLNKDVIERQRKQARELDAFADSLVTRNNVLNHQLEEIISQMDATIQQDLLERERIITSTRERGFYAIAIATTLMLLVIVAQILVIRKDSRKIQKKEEENEDLIRIGIPEHCRPAFDFCQKTAFQTHPFRSIVGHCQNPTGCMCIVGHTFVESHTFAMGITGKGYGRKNN